VRKQIGQFLGLGILYLLRGIAFGANVAVPWTYPAEDGTLQAVESAGNGDRLYFSESTFVFSEQVSVELDKFLGLCGSEFDGSGRPTTVLQKAEGAEGRFFDFAGAAGDVSALTFEGENSPYGGALSSVVFSGNIQSCVFANNSESAEGGAVFCKCFEGNIQSSFFINNSSGTDGGALCVEGINSPIQYFIGNIQNSIFSGNSTANGGRGGAIYFDKFCSEDGDDQADLGGSYFLGNSAGILGGALYASVDAQLAARSGDVIFQRNLADGHPNGMHFANLNNGQRILIGAAEGHTFWNYDPIWSGTSDGEKLAHQNLFLEINANSGETGTVLFDRHRSDIWFQGANGATVFNGTLALQNGASFGASESNVWGFPANAGRFTLKESATLRIAYGQDIKRYEFNESTFKLESTLESVPYDPDSMRSGIYAGIADLLGNLQFILPLNVTTNTPMLSIPFGEVTVSPSTIIDVGVSPYGDGPFALSEGQSVTLLDCASLDCERTTFPNCDGSSIPNVRTGYHFSVLQDGNRILAKFLGTGSGSSSSGSSSSTASSSISGSSSIASSSSSSGESFSSGSSGSAASSSSGSDVGAIRRKILGEGWLAGVALVNGGGDRLEFPVAKSVATFCSLDGSLEWHRENPHLKAHGTSLAAGLTGAAGPLTCGLFFEGIFARTDSGKEWDGEWEISGRGQARAIGGGAFLLIDFEWASVDCPRIEVAIRTGRLRNRWNVKDSSGNGLAFDGTAPYVGIRLGAAYGLLWKEKFPINFYGKCFWSHLFSEEFEGEGIFFRYLDSFRLRLGGRLTYPADRRLVPLFGAYYEQELAGTAVGSAEGSKIPQATLRGGSAAGEGGFSYRPISHVAVDLLVRGSAGRESGISASIVGKYEF
jgi:predicted outer membrane repeat protein